MDYRNTLIDHVQTMEATIIRKILMYSLHTRPTGYYKPLAKETPDELKEKER
jgi:hypothetical protein